MMAMSSDSSLPYRKFRTSGIEFEVLARYDIKKVCGHGAFGIVTSAIDLETGMSVAIKKITNAFLDPVKSKQTLREIRLMKKFSHENITRILNLIPPSGQKFEDLYIVEDLMETDLHRVIYSRQDLTIDHIQCFIYQILRGLKYLHSANVIHRDLKPSNILVNSNCDVKICDFGLSCLAESENSLDKTEYVVTRWYRAPEVMLARQEYTKAIDVWSVGCILAELLARQPIFPGDDYLAQLEIICQKIGRPGEDELNFVTSKRAKEFILALPTVDKPRNLADYFPKYFDQLEAIDILRNMLKFQPESRISVDGALTHPFMSTMHNSEDEPIADFQISFDFDFDSSKVHSKEDDSFETANKELKQLIWDEILHFHPHLPVNPPCSTACNTPSTSSSSSSSSSSANPLSVSSGGGESAADSSHRGASSLDETSDHDSHSNNNNNKSSNSNGGSHNHNDLGRHSQSHKRAVDCLSSSSSLASSLSVSSTGSGSGASDKDSVSSSQDDQHHQHHHHHHQQQQSLPHHNHSTHRSKPSNPFSSSMAAAANLMSSSSMSSTSTLSGSQAQSQAQPAGSTEAGQLLFQVLQTSTTVPQNRHEVMPSSSAISSVVDAAYAKSVRFVDILQLSASGLQTPMSPPSLPLKRAKTPKASISTPNTFVPPS